MNQTHHKFKVFLGELSPDGSPDALAAQIERFVQEHQVSPKSIGAEYLERDHRVILTLGYRDDEPAVPVQIKAVRIGVLGSPPDHGAIESAMAAAAAAVNNIICHELYVTDKDELFMIFMTSQGA